MIGSGYKIFRLTVLSLFLLSPLSCGTESNPTTTPNADLSGLPTGDGPSIISFGTNVAELTDGESLRFVAVVTDSSGINNLVGGQLSSPDGTIRYGAFVAAQQGSYSIDLTWAQISQTKLFSFGAEEKRAFVGEFYNVAGKKTSQSIEVRFHCKGEPACEGRCVTTGNSCPLSADKLCIAGACQTGCYVNKTFVGENAMSTLNACQVCQSAVSKTSLQTLADYASCQTGLTCGSGKCEVPFARQDTKGLGSLFSVAAPTAMLQVAVGGTGKVVRTTDGGTTWTIINSGITDSLYGVFAVSATELYACGGTGTVIKSADGGATWTKLTTGSASTFNAVWASSTNDIWVVGGGGTILRSTNGGTTWTRLTTPSTAYLNAIWGSGAGDVYMVGETGVAWHSASSGTTFTTLATGTTVSLSGVWASAATDVYLVGGNGTILRSTTAGASWTKLTPPNTASVSAVWGSAANNVYFVGANGQVWRTTDSQNLTVIPTASTSLFYSVNGSAANAFTVVANSPNVLRKL